MYQWWIWHSNWDFHLTPASRIPLACSVEAIPACIYTGVSRIRFILPMFSDDPLHVLVTSRDHSFQGSLCAGFSIPNRPLYNHTIFNSAYFQSVMGAGFRGRHTEQWHETLRCSKIQWGYDSTLVYESSTTLGKEQRCASKDWHTEGPKMTTWAWPFVIYLPLGAAEHVCLLWSFIV